MTSNNGFPRLTFKNVPELVKFSSRGDLHFVSYQRGVETYGLIFTLHSFGAAMVQITRWSSHKELAFDWKDTGVVSQAMRIYRKKMLDENCSGSKGSCEEDST